SASSRGWTTGSGSPGSRIAAVGSRRSSRTGYSTVSCAVMEGTLVRSRGPASASTSAGSWRPAIPAGSSSTGASSAGAAASPYASQEPRRGEACLALRNRPASGYGGANRAPSAVSLPLLASAGRFDDGAQPHRLLGPPDQPGRGQPSGPGPAGLLRGTRPGWRRADHHRGAVGPSHRPRLPAPDHGLRPGRGPSLPGADPPH